MDRHTDRYCANDGVDVYTKEQLLAVLQEICPDALAKFPPSDSFEIREHHPGEYAVQIGYTTAGSAKRISNLLWLDERKQDQAHGRHMGLYYTTADDTSCNKHVARRGRIKGTKVFGKLEQVERGLISDGFGTRFCSDSFISPFCRPIRTLLRFVLVYCDRAAEYRTLEKNGKKEVGLAPLVRILKEIAKHSNTTDPPPAMEVATGSPNNYKEKEKTGVIEEALYKQRNRKPVAVRLTADDGSPS